MKELINFDSKKNRIAICIIVGAIITYPFIIQLVFGCFGIDLEQKRLWTFNMPIKDFTSSWISLWSVVCAIIGVYQVYERICVSKIQHKELTILQNKQLDTQIDNRYSTYINMLNSDNETVRLNTICNLYSFAKEYNEYVQSVCKNFCDILCSSDKHSVKEKKRVIRYLFAKNSIFRTQEKELNNCNLEGLSFNELHINNAKFNNSRIDKCSFQSTTITNSEFVAAQIHSILFKHVTIKNASFKDAQILNSSQFDRNIIFHKISFTGTSFDTADFNKCSFSECDFSNAVINKSNYCNNKFVKCNLDFHSINQTSFTFIESKQMKEFEEMLANTNNMHIEGNAVQFV